MRAPLRVCPTRLCMCACALARAFACEARGVCWCVCVCVVALACIPPAMICAAEYAVARTYASATTASARSLRAFLCCGMRVGPQALCMRVSIHMHTYACTGTVNVTMLSHSSMHRHNHKHRHSECHRLSTMHLYPQMQGCSTDTHVDTQTRVGADTHAQAHAPDIYCAWDRRNMNTLRALSAACMRKCIYICTDGLHHVITSHAHAFNVISVGIPT